MCSLRIKGMFTNSNFILCRPHDPTDVEPDSSKKISSMINWWIGYLKASYDTKIILGNLNDQIGCERVYEGTSLKSKKRSERERGNFSKPKTSKTIDKGNSCIRCVLTNIVRSSTFFKRKQINKATWTAHDGTSIPK